MGDFLKLAGVCLCAAILTAALDRREHALAAGVGLLAGAIALMAVVRSLRPAAQMIEEMSELSGLGAPYLQPLLKAVCIGVVTQIACSVCVEGGQNTLAKIVEISGVCAVTVTSLPLLRSALELIRQMMGG